LQILKKIADQKETKVKKRLPEKDVLLNLIERTIKQIETGNQRQLKSHRPYLTGIKKGKMKHD